MSGALRLSSRCFARGSRCDGIRCRLSQRHQTGELSDVAGFELVEGGYAEQLHGATDLARQDLDRAVEILSSEIRRTMKLLGVSTLDELEPGHVTQLARLVPLA